MTIDKTIQRIGAIGAELDALVDELEKVTPRSATARTTTSTDDLLDAVIVRQVEDAADRLAALRAAARPTTPVAEAGASDDNIIDVTDYKEVPHDG